MVPLSASGMPHVPGCGDDPGPEMYDTRFVQATTNLGDAVQVIAGVSTVRLYPATQDGTMDAPYSGPEGALKIATNLIEFDESGYGLPQCFQTCNNDYYGCVALSYIEGCSGTSSQCLMADGLFASINSSTLYMEDASGSPNACGNTPVTFLKFCNDPGEINALFTQNLRSIFVFIPFP